MKTHQTLQIFKAGSHKASNGTTLSFSEAQLSASANAYDPALHEAPLVIGHPKADLPAFGWVKSLKFSEDALEAEPFQVNADFAEMVKNGAFKKISASFYTPDSLTNPVPGVYYLRHVGFLGAEPPAVKGLRSPEFSDAQEGVVEFSEMDFSAYDERFIVKLFRNIREWLISEKDIDVAEKVIPEWAMTMLEESAAEEVINERNEYQQSPLFNEGDEMSADDKARLVALEAENATLKQQQADFAEAQLKTRRDAAHAENVSFAEGLVKSGQLLPAHKDAVIAALNFVSAPAEVVEFGEGEAKKPLVEGLKLALTSAAKVVDFGERAAGDVSSNPADYVLPAGATVNQEALEIHHKALEYAEKNNCEYLTAVKAVGGK